MKAKDCPKCGAPFTDKIEKRERRDPASRGMEVAIVARKICVNGHRHDETWDGKD